MTTEKLVLWNVWPVAKGEPLSSNNFMRFSMKPTCRLCFFKISWYSLVGTLLDVATRRMKKLYMSVNGVSPHTGGDVNVVGVGGHLVDEGLDLRWREAVQQVLQVHLVCIRIITKLSTRCFSRRNCLNNSLNRAHLSVDFKHKNYFIRTLED